MTITIHQPEFMPYGGFFAKAMRADKFVLLDTVQFKKNYFENRNRVLVSGQPGYVTVPVRHKDRLKSTIADIELAAEDDRWARKLVDTLRANYRKHPYFDQVFPFFEALFAEPHVRLAPLNIRIILFLAERLGLTCDWLIASEHEVPGQQSELLAEWTARLGGGDYLSGALGRNYLQAEPFERRNLTVHYHEFHAQSYQQPGAAAFEPNLSVFDLLCCLPPQQAREVLLAGSEVHAA